MSQVLTLTLPKDTSPEDVEALQNEIKSMSEVKAAGVDNPRAVDLTAIAAGITVWLNLIGPASDVVKKIIDLIRGKGLSNVEISLPNGGKIKVDSASAAEVEQLLKAVQKTA